MNAQQRLDELRITVKSAIDQALNTVANTRLGLRVIYREDNISVTTTTSELLIRFIASDFKFLCRIPLWVNNYYDLTSDGDLLTSFNTIRAARIDQWVFDTMLGCQELQHWISWNQVKESMDEEKANQQPSNISFSLTVQHTKNRFTRIEGDEVWDYVEMPTDTTMKFVDPKNSETLQSARLEISFEGEELSIEDLVTEFRRQYVEKQ